MIDIKEVGIMLLLSFLGGVTGVLTGKLLWDRVPDPVEPEFVYIVAVGDTGTIAEKRINETGDEIVFCWVEDMETIACLAIDEALTDTVFFLEERKYVP